MSLRVSMAETLGYHHRSPNVLQRPARRISVSRPGAWLFSKVLRHLDGIALMASGDRASVTSVIAGLPILELSTVGARSGRQRSTVLMGIPYHEAIAIAGGNFGQSNTPSWVYNLTAHPQAVLAYRGRTVKVRARPASESELAEIIAGAAIAYPPATGYVHPASGREVRAFILEPALRA